MNNMVFLMGLYPNTIYDEIISNSIAMPQYAADALQKSFLTGISSSVQTTVINLPYVGSYPKRYKSLFVPSITCKEFGADIRSYKFCNLSFLKNFHRIWIAYKALKAWTSENPKNRTITIYAIHLPFLIAVAKLKKDIPDIKVIQIVPDLPEFMNSNPSRLQALSYKMLNKYYTNIDGWILLSKYMADKLHILDKPWNVIEGIYNPLDTPEEQINDNPSNIFRIFYGGTLAKRYGVMTLVNAVATSSNRKLELVICGLGDATEDIVNLSLKDTRIKFLGSIPRSEVLKQIRAANLLVNPRNNESEFTKYSFPSKTMEYLSSGVPTLLYRLAGIPDEYYDYCFSLEKYGVNTLKTEIERIANLPKSELEAMGKRAKTFILEKKNPEVQCEKLFSIMKQIETK